MNTVSDRQKRYRRIAFALAMLCCVWMADSLGTTAEFIGMERVPDGVRLDWRAGTNQWEFLEYCSGFNSTGTWNIVSAFPLPRPLTNAIVVYGIAGTNIVFRIRSED